MWTNDNENIWDITKVRAINSYPSQWFKSYLGSSIVVQSKNEEKNKRFGDT